MRVILDSREPSNIVNAIKKYPLFADAEISVAKLDAGDCWIDNLIIERKTISDLLASIVDNRLPNQANEMRELTEHCYFVICGSLTWSQQQKIIGTDWHFRSVQGALLQVQELGVCVIHAADDSDYPATLAWLAGRDLSKIVTLWPRKSGIPVTISDKVLASLPGIGPERATKLLNKYGSIADSIIALTDDNSELPEGISSKIRAGVREALGLSNGEYLLKETKNERSKE